MKILCLLLPLLSTATLSAQLTFSIVSGPAPSFNADGWEMHYDAHGHYYLKENDSAYNTDMNRSLLYSEDGGQHWAMTDYHPGRRHFAGLNGTVYAIENGELFRSDDNGVSYILIANNLPFVYSFHVRENGTMLISNMEGVFISDNQGQTWVQVSTVQGLFTDIVYGNPGIWGWNIAGGKFHLWFAPADGQPFSEVYTSTTVANANGTLFVAGEDGTLYCSIGGDYNRIIHSEDEGTTWMEATVKPGAPARITALAVVPDGPVVARLNDNLWYLSEDKGVNWLVDSGTIPANATAARSFPDASLFVTGTPLLRQYTGPGQFAFAAYGLDNSTRLSWPSPDTLRRWVRGGVLQTVNNNTTFIPVAQPNSTAACTQNFLDTGERYYQIQCNGTVLCTSDLGNHYDTVFRQSNLVDPSEHFEALIRNEDHIRLLTNEYLYTSTDAGHSWIHSAFIQDYHVFTQMAVSASGKVYINNFGKVWRTDDNGLTFVPLIDVPPNPQILHCSGETVFALYGNKLLFFSTDSGQNWQSCLSDPLDGNYNASENEITNFTVTDNGQIYAGGIFGGKSTLFHSPDLGQTWTRYPVGNGDDGTFCSIIGIGKDKRLYFYTAGSVVYPVAVYRTDQSALSDSKEPDISGGSLQIYPNPVWAQLTVSGLKDDTNQLELYDQAGCLVKRIAVPDGQSGIDVSQFAAGIYWLKACGPEGVQTGKWIKTPSKTD